VVEHSTIDPEFKGSDPATARHKEKVGRKKTLAVDNTTITSFMCVCVCVCVCV
jgi:hypothetical protein